MMYYDSTAADPRHASYCEGLRKAAGKPEPQLKVVVNEARRKAEDEASSLPAWGNVPARQRVNFLWRPYIPLSEITIFAGPPGIGKGTAAISIAARVSAGLPMPLSEERHPPARVLWLETEDSPVHTLAPRLEAAGARKDMVRIAKLGDPILRNLRTTIEANDVRLIVMSPFVSFLEGLEDANSELASRAALQKLVDAIDGLPCAIVGIMHPNKAVTAATLTRIMGSTAFIAFVRSVLVIGEKDDQKRLAHAKHNLSKRGDDILYSIIDEGPHPDDGMIRADWSKANDNCFVEALWDRRAEKKPHAIDWLVAYLMAEGETPASKVMEAAVAAGFNWSAVSRAGTRSKRITRTKDGMSGPWLWRVADE